MKTKKKKLIIMAVSIIAIICIGIVVLLLIMNNSKSESDPGITDFNAQPIDADTYFNDNGDVISTINANDSPDVTTERESFDIFTDRGFTDFPISTYYSMDGSYFDEKEIDNSSSETHPMYVTYYVNSSGDLWTIELINGCITAYPVSYIESSELGVPIIISETDTIVSYDGVSNKFFETIPNKSSLIIKKIDRIDSNSLDELTKEGIEKL